MAKPIPKTIEREICLFSHVNILLNSSVSWPSIFTLIWGNYQSTSNQSISYEPSVDKSSNSFVTSIRSVTRLGKSGLILDKCGKQGSQSLMSKVTESRNWRSWVRFFSPDEDFFRRQLCWELTVHHPAAALKPKRKKTNSNTLGRGLATRSVN